MDYYTWLQQRLLYGVSQAAVILSAMFYFALLYFVFAKHMTFFDNGVGDMIVLLLITAVFAFIFTLNYMARKHRLKWLCIPVIVISIGFISLLPVNLHRLEGKDERIQDIEATIPKKSRGNDEPRWEENP